MSALRLFLYWILTLIIGSAVLPIIYQLINFIFEGKSYGDAWGDYYLAYGCMSLIYSAMFSVPALLLFLIGNEILKRKIQDLDKYRKWMLYTQLGFSLICFLCIFPTIDRKMEQLLLTAILLSYPSIGLFLWNRHFSKIPK